jgi:tRNA U34 2-thiouridine synthase MnmA/TrmU
LEKEIINNQLFVIIRGQIVEIPSSSAIYKADEVIFSSKKDELLRTIAKRNYSLFDGFLVGEHQGVEHFKLGQRKGINVGGKNAPLYVIGINETANQLFVGEGEKHPGLWTNVLAFSENRIQLQNPDLNNNGSESGTEVSIHSTVTDIDMIATLYLFDGILYLEFEAPVSIAIHDHPLEIYFDDHSAATIKIN